MESPATLEFLFNVEVRIADTARVENSKNVLPVPRGRMGVTCITIINVGGGFNFQCATRSGILAGARPEPDWTGPDLTISKTRPDSTGLDELQTGFLTRSVDKTI